MDSGATLVSVEVAVAVKYAVLVTEVVMTSVITETDLEREEEMVRRQNMYLGGMENLLSSRKVRHGCVDSLGR